MPPRPRPYPLLLTPRYLPKPWGGRRLASVLGRSPPVPGPIGESWEVYDREGTASVVRNGVLAGKTLADVRDAPYPLLVKIIDATEKLSIQVHPDAVSAAELGGEAKTECWFVLHAEKGARVYRGFADDVDRTELEEALHEDRLEECLYSFEVAAGDTIFVPAGTVHTIGAGVLLAEVQQNSDTTYRLHDWGRMGLDGRPRALHVDRALQSIRFGPRSQDKVPAQLIEDEGSLRRLLLVRCEFFAVEHLTAMGTVTVEVEPSATPEASVLHVLSGGGELRPFDRRVEPVPLVPGDTVLLPFEHEAYEIACGTEVVRAMLFRV